MFVATTATSSPEASFSVDCRVSRYALYLGWALLQPWHRLVVRLQQHVAPVRQRHCRASLHTPCRHHPHHHTTPVLVHEACGQAQGLQMSPAPGSRSLQRPCTAPHPTPHGHGICCASRWREHSPCARRGPAQPAAPAGSRGLMPQKTRPSSSDGVVGQLRAEPQLLRLQQAAARAAVCGRERGCAAPAQQRCGADVVTGRDVSHGLSDQ